MAEIHRLSPEAHARLTAEHKDLTTRGRIDIAEKIEEARLLGDLSENGDYHAAKEEQGKMAGRILHLESVLRDCVLLDERVEGVVAPGAVIELRFAGDADTERFLFGSIEERREDLEVVSPRSPMGQALENGTVGQKVSYLAGGDEMTVEIIAIEV